MSHLSYEGQSEVDYCIECAVKHNQTAKVLMREALQRAEAENNPASQGVKEKVRGVVEELTGTEDDTNTTKNDTITNLNTATRDLRKYIYSTNAEIGGADIPTLREIKNRIDKLVDQTYDAREKEGICVPCVSWICYGKKECINFLEKAAETGNKETFFKAVEEAKKKFYGNPGPPSNPEKKIGKTLNRNNNNSIDDVKMPIVERDFLTRLGGGLLNGLIDFGLEWNYPNGPAELYIQPVPQLPPLDEWLVVGAAVAPWLIGHFMKNDTVKKIGEGGLLYSVPMFLHHTLMYSTGVWPVTPAAPAYVPRAVARPTPTYGQRVSPAVTTRDHVRYVVT